MINQLLTGSPAAYSDGIQKPNISTSFGEKAPTPTLSALVRKTVLLRADFVLTKDLEWAYKGKFCCEIDTGVL